MAQQTTSPRPLSVAAGVKLVAMREISTAFRSKAIWWSLGITVALLVLALLGGRYFGDFMDKITGADKQVSVGTTLSETDLAPLAAGGTQITSYPTVDAALAQLENGTVDALVLPAAQAQGIELYTSDGAAIPEQLIASAPSVVVIGLDSTPNSLVSALTVTPVAGQLEAQEQQIPMGLLSLIAFGYGLVFFISIVSFTQRLAQAIVEEKSSRIVEMLVSTMRPSTMLAGKVLGGTVLAIGQVLVVVATVLICLGVTGQSIEIPDISVSLIWFSVLTLFGFMFYASIYAALASTVSRPEDVASVTMLPTLLLMVPYLVPAYGIGNAEVMGWLSYLPISSPVAMSLRVLLGSAQWWEPVVALVVLLVALVLVIWLAGRIYKNSVLRTGGRVKLSEALRAS